MGEFSYIKIDPESYDPATKSFRLPEGAKHIPGSLTSGGPMSGPETCEWKLDSLALTAMQDYNVGNADNWFYSFRMGMAGVVERLAGLKIHTTVLHEWTGRRYPMFPDHDVVVSLFCMDSAIECFTFMLNALGQAFDKAAFRDIATESGLRGIAPRDIIGKSPKTGYGRLFPTLQAHWYDNADLIEMITANHDVTKHRHSPPGGALLRQDPPEGYFEAMGISGTSIEASIERGRRTPFKQLSLSKYPRLPGDDPKRQEYTSLEELESGFAHFIPKSFCLALEDARVTLPLRDPKLHLHTVRTPR